MADHHVVRPRNADHRVTVGWDQTLHTFWCRVWDRKRDVPIAHLGQREREIIDIIDLRKRVHRYAYFNDDIRKALQADRDAGRPAS